MEQDEQMNPDLLSDMEDMQEEQMQDQFDDQADGQQEQGYGFPEPEEKHNQHTFISKAIDMKDVEKVSYLKQEELGRPLFNVRFLLDMEDIAKHYLDPLLEDEKENLKLRNRIADYFRNKINNICSSGLSNNGFIQSMNVSRKLETTRTRVRGNPENLNVGDKKRPR